MTTRPKPMRLALLETGEPKSVCPSNQWIWDEEIALVQAMRSIKLEVREARERGDAAAIDRLRVRFKELDEQREKIRRKRLDSLGLFGYD